MSFDCICFYVFSNWDWNLSATTRPFCTQAPNYLDTGNNKGAFLKLTKCSCHGFRVPLAGKVFMSPADISGAGKVAAASPIARFC